MFLRVRHRKALCRDKSGACFRGFLRCSRYSSCGCDKLSKTGELYLHYLRGCKVFALLFCASAFVVSRVVLNSAQHSVFCACAVRRLFCAHCEFCSASGALVLHRLH